MSGTCTIGHLNQKKVSSKSHSTSSEGGVKNLRIVAPHPTTGYGPCVKTSSPSSLGLREKLNRALKMSRGGGVKSPNHSSGRLFWRFFFAAPPAFIGFKTRSLGNAKFGVPRPVTWFQPLTASKPAVPHPGLLPPKSDVVQNPREGSPATRYEYRSGEAAVANV